MSGNSRSTVPKRSFRQRKQQTRLHFSSLSSSSPGKQAYSQAVQDRLAGVTFEGANNSTRTASEMSPDPISLLSPEPSSQVQREVKKPLQMSHHTSYPSLPTRKRVSRVHLSDSSDEDDLIQAAQKRTKLSSPPDSAPTPESLPRRHSRRLQQGSSSSPLRSGISGSENEIDELPSSPPTRRSSRLQQRSSPPASSTRHELPLVSSLSASASPANEQSKLSDLGSPETSDDDVVMVTKPTPRRKSRLDVNDPFIVNNDALQHDSYPFDNQGRAMSRKKGGGDDFVVADDEVEYISSEEERPRNRRIVQKKLSRNENFITDDDDDIEQISSGGEDNNTLSKPRRQSSSHKSLRKHQVRTQQEQDELDEDLQDLQSSDQDTPRTKARRTRGGPVTTKMDKTRQHLELLKKRRAGENITRVLDSDEELDDEQADDQEDDQEGADLDLIGEPSFAHHDGGIISSDTDQSEIDESANQGNLEEDFIEDDTDDRPDQRHSGIPIQFTHYAKEKPKELFIHIVEWMVKNKISPAFERDDDLYNLAFARVDDQVTAQAGSRLISAAWGNDFKNAILARPGMKVEVLPGEDEDHMRSCDACNRINNPARYEFVFSGEPYYKKTLEPIDNSDDDEENQDENDDDSVTYNEAGHIIASSETRFYLGRFCAANAQMGHKLTHWKYNLNEALINYLDSQGVLSDSAIVAREKKNKRKRAQEAENIVDQMEQTGKISELWADFQNDLDDARIGMKDFEKKGGRTKGRVGAIQSKSRGLVSEWDKDKFRTRTAKAQESDSDDE